MRGWFLLPLLHCVVVTLYTTLRVVSCTAEFNCAMLAAADSIARANCRSFLKSRSVSPNHRRWITGSATPQTNWSLRLSFKINSAVSCAPAFDQNHNVWPNFSVPAQSHQLIDPSSFRSSRNCNVERLYLVSVGNAHFASPEIHPRVCFW